ncbi:MAG: EAL domain-containing protein [Actinomycetota bacterium]|nr:EAL domain-containing protein [Actinomycetota bacterium]
MPTRVAVLGGDLTRLAELVGAGRVETVECSSIAEVADEVRRRAAAVVADVSGVEGVRPELGDLLDSLTVGLLVVRGDGEICYLNRASAQIFGRDADTLMREPLGIAVGPAGQFDVEIVRPDKRRCVVEVRTRAIEWAGAEATLLELRDVTVSRNIEHRLLSSAELYHVADAAANDGLWDWRLDSGEIICSPRWRELLELPEDEPARIDAWLDRIHPDDRKELIISLRAHLGGVEHALEHEHRIRVPTGERWVRVRGLAIRDEDGTVTRVSGSISDVTERVEAQQRVERGQTTDLVTGVANRRYFTSLLEDAAGPQAATSGPNFAVLVVDIDRFTLINEALGHARADLVLRGVAEVLDQNARPGDLVGRIGGDEFALLVRRIRSPRDARSVAERLRAAMDEPLRIDGSEIDVGISIGVAMAGLPGEPPGAVLSRAQSATERAKRTGGRRIEMFDASWSKEVGAELTLEGDLRNAVRTGGFTVEYQPIVDLRGDGFRPLEPSLRGFEALVRWSHPSEGRMAPARFLPLAERTGMIVAIGEQVLRDACVQLSEWRDRDGVDASISVNVSARQLGDRSLIDLVTEALDVSGLPGDRLTLEITETAVIENVDAAAKVLGEIHDLGVQLHADDFGTGHAALSYLRTFPFDALKIDRAFVEGLGEDDDLTKFVETIVALARKLGLDVIGEGVERRRQLSILTDLGCTTAQGYLFAPPLPPAAALRAASDAELRARLGS